MSQYNSQKSSGTSRSRAKSSSSGAKTTSRSSSTRSSSGAGNKNGSSRNSSSRNSNYRSNYSYGNRNSSTRHTGRKRKNRNGGFMKLAIGGVVLIIAIAIIVSLLKGMGGSGSKEASGADTTAAPPETELQKEVSVDGINITGMSREEAKEAILKNYPWAMTVVWEDKTYEVANLVETKVDALLEEIYAGKPEESYVLDISGMEEAVRAEAANVAAQWNKKAKNGSISSYDASADKFIFSGAETGLAVDEDKLISDIEAALNEKDFDAEIAASVATIQPEYTEDAARQRYEKIGTFTTKTTANSNRNTNVKLAAQAINGTVVQPGQEFSFNGTVGERTEAKGYKGAAAYNNGEVVQEIGGGVCQVSSTLYNAVVKAGLKTTMRRSHTYEPSYVTPGTDATVSWGGPDYKFVNNSSAGIGIRAHYADQTLTVSIYGIPILEDGVTYSLQSTKLTDTDPPTPTYEEDPTLEPGVEKVKSSGSIGSKWETRLVIKKNGELVSQNVDHTVTYKGHAPVILRNTSGTVAATTAAAGASDPSEGSVAPEGAGDGFAESSESGIQSSTAAPTSASDTTTVPSTTAASTKAPTETSAAEPTSAAKPTAASQAESTAVPTVSAPTASANPTAAEGGSSQAPGNSPTAASDTVQTIAPNPGA
ncbi:MAG: VanW family protein [Brotaphodocola sp.]